MEVKIEPIDIILEELGPYRQTLKTYTITHEFKGKYGDSMMTQWLWQLPDTHKIILARTAKDNIIGWGIGTSYIDNFNKRLFNARTCLVGIYILKEHRQKGYGYQIGQKLFDYVKEQRWYERIYMNFRTKGATQMYKKLCEYIGVKRRPYTPPSMEHDKSWKLVKL